jgi:hypothetical protein
MDTKWQCYAWEGKGFITEMNMQEACHRRHAEINLINRLQLKGSC